jgi:signal peptidase II
VSTTPAQADPTATPDQGPDQGPVHTPAKYALFGVVAVIFTVADQASKIWVRGNLAEHRDELQIIPGFLSFIHAQNPGAAFGMLVGFEHRMMIFAGFTVIAMGVLWSMYKQLEDDDRFQAVIVSLIFAGAVGNAIDRVHKGTVTDFVKMYTDDPKWASWCVEHFGTSEYATWNVADACIVVGVCLYLLHYLMTAFETPKAVAAEDVGENPLARADEAPQE